MIAGHGPSGHTRQCPVAFVTETLVMQETIVDDRATRISEARLKGYERDACGLLELHPGAQRHLP